MNVYEQDARDEMDLAQNIILGALAVTLMVIAVLIGYEYWLNPKNPGHTPALIMFGTMCATANFIYLYFVRKVKVAWIPSAVIGLLLWAMTYALIFTP